MRQSHLVVALLVAVVLGFTLGGCVLQKEHDKVVAQLEQTRNELKLAKSGLGEAQNSLAASEQSLKTADAAVLEKESQLLQARKELQDLQSRLESAEKQRSELEKKIVGLSDAKRGADKEATALQTALQKEAELLRANLGKKDSEIAGLKGRVTDREGQVKRLETENATLKAEKPAPE